MGKEFYQMCTLFDVHPTNRILWGELKNSYLKRLSQETKKDREADFYLLNIGTYDSTERARSLCEIISLLDPKIVGAEEAVGKVLTTISAHSKIIVDVLRKTAWSKNFCAMRALVDANVMAIDCIDTELSNNAKFMLEVAIQNTTQSHQWKVYQKIGDKLKCDELFMTMFLEGVVKKYRESNLPESLNNDFTTIMTIIYGERCYLQSEFLLTNATFWQKAIELNLDKVLKNRSIRKILVNLSLIDTKKEEKIGEKETYSAEKENVEENHELDTHSEVDDSESVTEVETNSEDATAEMSSIQEKNPSEEVKEDAVEKYEASKISKISEIVRKIMEDEDHFYTFAHEDETDITVFDLLNVAEEKTEMVEVILRAMISSNPSKNLSVYDYVRMFGSGLEYKEIRDALAMFCDKAREVAPELKGRNKAINQAHIKALRVMQPYERPYDSVNFLGSKLGYQKDDMPLRLIEITEERLSEIVAHLMQTGQIECYHTVNETIKDFVRNRW